MPNLPNYVKTIWENAPSEETPLNAENLNNIENQIESLTNQILEDDTKVKLVYKGEVALLINLPTTGQEVGDYYIVTEKGVPYLWDGDSFNPQVIIPEMNLSEQSIGTLISSADVKVTPGVDDTFGYSDSEDVTNPNILKRLTWGNLRASLATFFEDVFALVLHGHEIGDITDLVTVLNGKSNTGHTHDDRYFTETEVNALLKADERPIQLALSDESTAITTGTSKLTFRIPYACKLTKIPRINLNTVSSSGLVTVDIKKNGATIFSTLLTIDANEKTSVTATTPCVLSTNPTTFADDDEITFNITVAGTGAKGLKATLFVEKV